MIKNYFVFLDERQGDDDGCGAGVCNPATDHGEAAV